MDKGTKDSVNSISKLKKRIRDVKRTLTRESQTAESIISNKRRLYVLEYELGEKIINEKERTNALKSHNVKHFERKKIDRKIKQAEKKLKECTEEDKAILEAKLKKLNVDRLYIKYFPKTLTYISLFPKENGETPKQKKQKEDIQDMIRACVDKGDDECQQLTKHYRLLCREKMIKKKLIPAATPLDDSEAVVEEKETAEFVVNGDKSNRDDFFE